MALWVNGAIRGRGLLRLSFFAPTVLPMIAVANIWLFFYTPDYGLVDQLLGLFGAGAHNWLGTRSTALGCLIVVTIWKERSEAHTSELQSLMRISYAVLCLKKKTVTHIMIHL